MSIGPVFTDEESKEVLQRYRKLLRAAKPFLKEGDTKLIKKAFNISLEAHKDMRRKSGEPYIVHPLAVAQIVVEEIGLGTTSIVSALLHDVVEDTELEIKDIEREFGSKVAQIIDGLTKIAGVFDHGTSQQAENFRKMLLTLSEDVRVILIKLADRLHNMRTLDAMPKAKQLKIASETLYLYAPLAHRLGLYLIKSELEDLYLKYVEPETYRDIVTKINEKKHSRNKFIKDFVTPIEKELAKQGLNFIVKGRPKSIHSIWNKMKKQRIPFEEVYDLLAVRIIIDTPIEQEKAACWQVYSIVTDFYKPNPDRLRDWISTPRSNGYESLHTTVMSQTGQWVEVQIRTTRMDEIAEKGYAAHWKYKDVNQGNVKEKASGLEEWLARVREMLEKSDMPAEEFVDDFRNNLFTEEIFVFTPKGELKTLPNGATALDFAFDIHSEVGKNCIGAKVNQKLVPLNHMLTNGDQVEILTSAKQKPSEDWLKFVVTSKAKTKIKEVLREEKKKIALEGELFVTKKINKKELEGHSEVLTHLKNTFRTKTLFDFYYQVGNGVIKLKDILDLKKAIEDKTLSKKNNTVDKQSTSDSNTVDTKQSNDVLLIGDDLDSIDYTLAKCCNPIRGDDVFGFITTDEGIKIHRTSCPNAVKLMSSYSYRMIKAKWTSQDELAFLTGIKITGTDRVGLVNDLTQIISNELKVNIRSITIDTNNSIFEGNIMLFVQDTKHLNLLIEKIRNIPGVVGVVRYT